MNYSNNTNAYLTEHKDTDNNILDTNNSKDNFSYSSDNFIYSPLKCHYPSSYIPSDEYKSSKCIRIKKRSSSHNKNRHKKNTEYEQNKILTKNLSQDESEISVKKHMDILQEDRNKIINTLLKNSEKKSNDKNRADGTIYSDNDELSFFSINSLPTISSFSLDSSDQTKSTIKRIYKNYMDNISISIDSPSKLSNETFLKYIETPIVEKTKIMFSKEEKNNKYHTENIYEATQTSNKTYRNSEKISDNSNNRSFSLSNSPIIQYQNHKIIDNTVPDNILLTPKSKNSSPTSNFANSFSSNSSVTETEKKNKELLKNSNNKEKRNRRSILEKYTSPKHSTIPSFINNITTKFDSEINYIKENPLIVSSSSYSSKKPLNNLSNKDSIIFTGNDTLDDVSDVNEDLEIISPSNSNCSLLNEKENISKNKDELNASRSSQKIIKDYKNESVLAASHSLLFDSKYHDSSKIKDNIYTTPKCSKKSSSDNTKSTSKNVDNKKVEGEKDSNSFQIISPTKSFKEFLRDSRMVTKKHEGHEFKFSSKNNNQTINLEKDFVDVVKSFTNESFEYSVDDSIKLQYANSNKSNKNYSLPLISGSIDNSNISSSHISTDNNTYQYFSLNTETNTETNTEDIYLSIRKNNSYDDKKYDTLSSSKNNNYNDKKYDTLSSSKNINYNDKKYDSLSSSRNNNYNDKKYNTLSIRKNNNFDDKKNDTKKQDFFSRQSLSDKSKPLESHDYKKTIEVKVDNNEHDHDIDNFVNNNDDLFNKYRKDELKINNNQHLNGVKVYNKSQNSVNKSLNNYSTLINIDEEDDILSDANQKGFKKFNEVLNNLSNIRQSDLYIIQSKSSIATNNKSSNNIKSYSSYKKEHNIPSLETDEIAFNTTIFSDFENHSYSDNTNDHINNNKSSHVYPFNTNNDQAIIFNDKEEEDNNSISFSSSDMIIENDESLLSLDKLVAISDKEKDEIKKKEKKKSLNFEDDQHSIIYDLKENKIFDEISFENKDFIDYSNKPSFSSKHSEESALLKTNLLSKGISLNHNNESFLNYSSIEPSLINNNSDDIKENEGDKNEKPVFDSFSKYTKYHIHSPSRETNHSVLPERERNNHKKEITKTSSILSSPTLFNYQHQDLEKDNEEKYGKKNSRAEDRDMLKKLLSESDQNNMKLVCNIITRMNTIQNDLNRKFEMHSKLLENLMAVKEDSLLTNDTIYRHNDSNSHHGHTYTQNTYSSTLTNSTNSLSSTYYHNQFKALKSYQKDIEKLNKYQNSNMEYLLEIINDLKRK